MRSPGPNDFPCGVYKGQPKSLQQYSRITKTFGGPSLLSSPDQNIKMWAVTVCKLPSQTKVAIMPTNIQPVIIENIFFFRPWASLEGDVENYWSVTRCHLKVLCHVHENSSLTQGLSRHLLKKVTSKESCFLFCIIRRKKFSASRISVELIRWTRCCAFVWLLILADAAKQYF